MAVVKRRRARGPKPLDPSADGWYDPETFRRNYVSIVRYGLTSQSSSVRFGRRLLGWCLLACLSLTAIGAAVIALTS